MFMDLIRKRRSIRKYQKKEIEPEKITLLKEACLRSPSSRNLNPWQFIFVTDKKLLSQLSSSKTHGSEFLKNAPLGVVVLSDPKRCDVWIEDCSIASIYLILAAHDMGLGACWIQIRERNHSPEKKSSDFVKDLLKIPSHLEVESIIAAGYPAEEIPPLKEGELEKGKIFLNLYPGNNNK